MQGRFLCVIFAWVILVSPSMVLAIRSRLMNGELDVYCNGTVITQTTGSHAGFCAMMCQNTAQCVAFSQRAGSQCLLHTHFCSSQDLVAEQGSYYTRKFLFSKYQLV